MVFDGVVARFPAPLTLAGGQSERVSGCFVTGNFFDVLGVRAQIGRPSRGRRSHAGRPSGRGAEPPLLDAALRRGSRRAQPQHFAQRPADDDRHVTPPGFGIVVGENPDVMVPVTMKAQMTPTPGRPPELHQPVADDRGAARAWRLASAGRGRHERRLPSDQRLDQAAVGRFAIVPRSLPEQASVPAA
jgi:hypothetical protein